MFTHGLPKLHLRFSFQIITHQDSMFASQQARLIDLTINSSYGAFKIDGERIAVSGQVNTKKSLMSLAAPASMSSMALGVIKEPSTAMTVCMASAALV